jgi:hypothetical protein
MEPRQLLQTLFSVPIGSKLDSDVPEAGQALRRTLDDIAEGKAFISEVFFSVLAAACFAGDVLKTAQADAIIDYVVRCWKDRGFLPAPADTPGLEVLVGTKRPPMIYSTYYGSQILSMLGITMEGEKLDAIARYVLAQQQSSGWLYNSQWADTSLSRKMESELFYETYYGVLLLKEAGLESRVKDKVSDAIKNRLREGVRYVSSLYFAVSTLLELGELTSAEHTIASDFLGRHKSADGIGIHDYLMEIVKVDEVAGQIQRYQFDQFEPSTVASYRALELVTRFQQQGYNVEAMTHIATAAAKFLRGKSAADNAGTPIRIASYEHILGPVTSVTELVMWLCRRFLIATVRVI